MREARANCDVVLAGATLADQVDALGNLATAALAAAEFDRGALHDPGTPGLCANCTAPATGRFCVNCGQPTHVHRSVLHVVEEFLHGLTHFDSKSWKTLPLLVFRPGKLTHDYVHGKRARYVPPVTLFLLTVFLMFFAFSFVEGPGNVSMVGDQMLISSPTERAKILADSDHAVAIIETELKAARSDPKKRGDVVGLDIALSAAKATNTAARRAVGAKQLFAADGKASAFTAAGLLTTLRDADKRGDLSVDTGNAAIDARVHHALENPELALYKVQSKAYKFSFLLVPMSLPVLWLMFMFRRHVYLYDHTVFALYSLSFMSIIVVAASALFATGMRNGAVFVPLLFLVPPLHMYVQLQGAYQLSVFGAAWRAVFLATAALLTLSFFAVLIALLGVVG